MKNAHDQVSVIGLGAMGSALARELVRNAHRVTVWNRTAAKAEPLVRGGAVLAPSAAAAISASPIVVVCVDDYEVTKTILDTDEVAPTLAGRVLIQLSSGSPQDARDCEAWARERGVDYLDGAIQAMPSQIGRPDTTILVSGADAAFRRSEPLLASLGGNVTYLGEQVGSASALDSAVLSFLFGGFIGFLHGSRICESEGLRVDSFGATVADLAPVIGEMIKHEGEVIQTEAYGNPQASVRICAKAMELFVREAREAQISSEFPTFGLGLFGKALAAGYGEEAVGAVIKVLRGAPDEALGSNQESRAATRGAWAPRS
jgi:3-hydroxyisobutyrate dehydrogenase-like beta-hydroxyacid dehydrogenase